MDTMQELQMLSKVSNFCWSLQICNNFKTRRHVCTTNTYMLCWSLYVVVEVNRQICMHQQHMWWMACFSNMVITMHQCIKCFFVFVSAFHLYLLYLNLYLYLRVVLGGKIQVGKFWQIWSAQLLAGSRLTIMPVFNDTAAKISSHCVWIYTYIFRLFVCVYRIRLQQFHQFHQNYYYHHTNIILTIIIIIGTLFHHTHKTSFFGWTFSIDVFPNNDYPRIGLGQNFSTKLLLLKLYKDKGDLNKRNK